MKKLCSIVLSMAMLLTALFAVPTQAVPYSGYLYVYEDLEGVVDGFYFVRNGAETPVNGVIADPTGRSGKVYGVSIPKTTATNPTAVSARQANLNVPVTMNTTTQTSLKFYMATGTPGGNRVNVTYSFSGVAKENAEDTFTGWYQTFQDVSWESGVWTTVCDTVTWTSALSYGFSSANALEEGNTVDWDSITITQIEIGLFGGTIVDEAKLNEGENALTFYFDELIYEPITEGAVDTIEYGKNLFTYGDFSNGQTYGFYANNDGGANKFIASVKTGRSPVDGNEGNYLNIANPDDAFAWNQLEYIGGEHATVRYLPNRMYEFTFWYRVNELYDQNKTCGFDVNDENAATAYGDIYFKWGIGNGTGAGEKLDANGLYTSANWPVDKYAQEDVLILDGEWHKASLNFAFDAKTFAEPLFRGAPFRATIVFQAHQSNQWMPMHMDMDLDNIQMIDKGPITNGDFEQGTGYFNRWYNNAGTGATDTRTTQPVYGWFAQDGATVAQSDDVRANATSGSTKSMKVSIAENSTGAKVTQPLSLLPTSSGRYKLSFWAKDDTLADGESLPLAVILDREQKAVAKDQATEVYQVPDFEFHTGTNEKITGGWGYNASVMETQSWRLTNDWQYFETYIDNAFPVIEGRENASIENILPRQPFMYFLYNFGDTNARSFLLDDVMLEDVPAPAPEVSDVVINGLADPGKQVSVSYTFTNPLGFEDGNTLVRVLANGVSLGSFKAQGGTFTIPETAIGKTLTFEILPIDTEGNVGKAYSTKNVATSCEWSKIYLDESLTSVRAYSGNDKTGVVIFAAYNGNQLTDIEVVDANLTASTKADISTKDFSVQDATKVKVMFWNSADGLVPFTMEEQTITK